MAATGGTRYQVNQAQVVYQIFDDEVIVVHPHNGVYYSLLGVSAHIWHCILGRASIDETVHELRSAYAGEASIIADATMNFIGELSEEKLVITAAEGVSGSVPVPFAGGGQKPFETPKMQKFTDMQELLLLDPVHDVQESGWPLANEQKAIRKG
jgi:hypothetical protein